jgi:transcription termination factor Rho
MVREGRLEVLPEGWGFLRHTVGEPYDQDVYVSQRQIQRFGLKSGDTVRGEVRPPRDAEKYYDMLVVKSINGQPAAG